MKLSSSYIMLVLVSGCLSLVGSKYSDKVLPVLPLPQVYNYKYAYCPSDFDSFSLDITNLCYGLFIDSLEDLECHKTREIENLIHEHIFTNTRKEIRGLCLPLNNDHFHVTHQEHFDYPNDCCQVLSILNNTLNSTCIRRYTDYYSLNIFRSLHVSLKIQLNFIHCEIDFVNLFSFYAL
eukprot:GHVR01001214.1.p1 GENE.GHVR01001214.1~~GHVR01001214.1.p1  ORF type:complete len:179 (+),score=1.64 GHVR01001214.1:251-787(+)